jgi:lipopolysaccharide biosynthesis protein
MMPENKIPSANFDSETDYPGFNDESKARAINQAQFQLKEIVAAKPWRLIFFFRNLRIIFRNRNLGFFKIISQSVETFKDAFNTATPVLRLHPDTRSERDRQLALFGKEVQQNGRIALILHLFYPDLWDETRGYLQSIPEPFDLFISIPAESNQIRQKMSNDYPDSYIYSCPNHGRDIAPFLEILNAIQGCNYEFICKIHTKKSLHLKDGDQWRNWLFAELLGDQKRVLEILHSFESDDSLGLITPEGYLYSAIDINSFINQRWIQKLSEMLAVDLHDFRFDYPAGSMFWCRARTMQKLAAAGIRTENFEPERCQLNHTLAHGIERIFGVLVMEQGYRLADTSGFTPINPGASHSYSIY